MTGWKNGYLTKSMLVKQIRETVAKAHKLNPCDIYINWLSQWRKVKYPTGLIEKVGSLVIRAPGFQTKSFAVTQQANHRWIMN